MDLSSSALIRYARTEEGRKKLRYAGVSVIFVPVGQILVQILGLWLDNFTTASLLAAAIVTLPNFFANKHFVWRVTSRENLRKQVFVFWVAVMLGVSFATLFTYVVESAMTDSSQLIRGTAVFFAQLLGYGLVWVGRFFILDRWLFKLASDLPAYVDEVLGEMSFDSITPRTEDGSPGTTPLASVRSDVRTHSALQPPDL